MNHEQILDRCNEYTLLSEYTDSHGREVVIVEVAGAQQRYLREEPDGAITGPLSEGDWINLRDSEITEAASERPIMRNVVEVNSAQYEDYDDCLAAAAEDYVSEHPEAAGYDLNARWCGGDYGSRETILLDVPLRTEAEILDEYGVVDDDHATTDELCDRLRAVGATACDETDLRAARAG